MGTATELSGSQPHESSCLCGAPHTALEALLEIARDLTASVAVENRYGRLLAAVRRVIPCDAACLLRLDGDELVPVAAHGLTPEAVVRRYDRREHPRLDIILRSPEPVRFPTDTDMPDPFDGYVAGDAHALDHIHACMGCALTEGGEVIGALTADSLDPAAFDALDLRVVATLGALAGAAMRTTALIEALERQADHRGRLARELARSAAAAHGELVGTGAAMARLRREIALVAGSDLTVLITGETGVGKEIVAHQVHQASRRAEEPLVHVNCAALPMSIAESELFGHVAGAFTGATRDRAGKFEIANGGTLFLDEVGELPVELQPKLLRALQQGEIQRVGSDRVHRVDVRVIAATNRDLEAEVAAGRFRADLYHRLAVFPLRVPALRERREDIPELAATFVDANRRRLGLGPARLTDDARARLAAADWPGNVRELENVVSRAVLRAAFGSGHEGPSLRSRRATIAIDAAHLELAPDRPAATPRLAAAEAAVEEASGAVAVATAGRPLRDLVDDFERQAILAAVARAGGNWAAAARELGMHRSNLHHLARRLGILGS